MTMSGRRALVWVALALGFSRAAAIPVGENWVLEPSLKIYGGAVTATYWGWSAIEGLPTGLHVSAGGAYGAAAYFREPDGSHYVPPSDPLDPYGDASFDRWYVEWGAGLRQGLPVDHLHALFLLRGVRLAYLEDDSLVFLSDLPDRTGITQNSLVAGLLYDRSTEERGYMTRDGARAEVSFEWAPAAMSRAEFGDTDFMRVNAELQVFRTLLDLAPGSRRNRLSLVLSDRLLGDVVWGGQIPLNARQSVGGTRWQAAFGGVMRGMGSRRYDAGLKVVNNLDLRLNLPSASAAVPGVRLFLDAGLQDDLSYRISFADEGFLLSTGISLLLNVGGIDTWVSAEYLLTRGEPMITFDFGRFY